MTAKLNTRVINATLVLVSLCFSLLFAEAFCRLALPRPGFTPLGGNWLPGATTPHPTRLYQLLPNYSAGPGGAYGEMEIKTNSIGLRERPLEELRRSKFRILAVGDSFTFGAGINRAQTWPAQLERALEKRLLSSSITVINAGIFGYNLAQIRDHTEELLPEFSPKVAILGVFSGGFDRLKDPYTIFGNIVIRQSEIRQAHLVKGGLVYSRMNNPSLIAFDHWLETHSYFGAQLFHGLHGIYERARVLSNTGDRRDSPATQHQTPERRFLREGLEEIRRMHKATNERGITLIVMLIASFDTVNRVSEDEERINDIVKAWCLAEGILTFDPTRALGRSQSSLRLNLKDHHWTASANAIVGEEFAQYLINQHALDGLRRTAP